MVRSKRRLEPIFDDSKSLDNHFFHHCLFSNREGLGTSLKIMGLATIDPHSHKVQTKLYKILKFGVNRPKSKQDTAICKVKIYKEMYGHDAVRHSVRMPYISLLILTLLNRYISVKTGVINTKLGNLVNLGVLFLTMGINLIIYRLILSPSLFEIRQ